MQNKDEKTAQGGAMTRQQAEQEMEQLRKVFPSVRMLTAEQVQAGEAVGDAARQALEEKTTHSRMEYRGQELYEVTALFAQVEGTPCVLELERRLDRIMLLDPEESEQLFNNLAEYRGKLYRDAVTGAYNERYYQEKYRSRILTAGVAVLRVDDFKAASGEACLQLLEQNATGISIVLLDIHMPGIDGFTVLEEMNQKNLLEQIPVIMISSEDTVDAVRRAFDLGASDYISRPFDAKVVYQRIINTIQLYAKQRRLSAMAADLAFEKERASRMMIGILSQVVEKRNGESRDHVQRVAQLTSMLLAGLAQKTDRYPLTREMRRTIATAAALHDIGKMEICEDLLHKEGPLTEAERRTLQSHTLLGAQMLEEQPECRDDAFARTAYNICRWHHERYDGGGYPDGLQGEQIPIEAQVVGLADVYERLVSRPVDGHARTHSEVVQMICTGVCGAFNPLLLDCLQDMEAEIARAMQDTPEET